MCDKLVQVKQLIEQDPIPNGIVLNINIAWAVYRKGQVPSDYLICRESYWGQICRLLGFVPAHIRCSGEGEIRRTK